MPGNGAAIKAIIFDFGNVIGFLDHRRTTNRLVPHSDLSPEAVHARLFGGDLETAYECGRLSSAEFLGQIRARCRFTCAEEVLAHAWSDIFWPNETIAALFPRLKPRYRLLLGSNTNELHAQQFCRQFADTLRHFEAVVLSHEIGARKPQAAFFEHCHRLAGCAAAECLFIDDLPVNIAGARAAGLHGIVYTGTPDLLQELTSFGILER